eukprot:5302-Heterococcus_DN1.PRE.1
MIEIQANKQNEPVAPLICYALQSVLMTCACSEYCSSVCCVSLQQLRAVHHTCILRLLTSVVHAAVGCRHGTVRTAYSIVVHAVRWLLLPRSLAHTA